MTPFKEIKKVLLKLIICFTLIIFSVSTQITQISADDTHDFAGGTGTRSDPYQIETADHLDNVRKYLNQMVYFQLNNDIDLTTFLEDKPAGWEPIGTDEFNLFAGHFDGKGHSVTGLWIKQNSATTDNPKHLIGLFGYTQDATITNLGVETNDTKGGIDIYDDNKTALVVGILTGYSINTIISNCYSKGEISIAGFVITVGGISGFISHSTVVESYSDVNISINNINEEVWIGGLIGTVRYSDLLKNFAKGEIYYDIADPVLGYVGGLIGYMYNRGDSIGVSNNYANVSIQISNNILHVGGFVGLFEYGRIQNSYAFGPINSNGSKGGFSGGTSYENTNVVNSYYNMETTGLSEANGYVVFGTSCQQAIGLTTSQMISMDVLNLSTGSMGSFNPSIWTKRACDTDNCYFPELSGMSQTNETVSKESTRFSRLPISMKDAVYGDFIPGETLSQVKLSASFYDQNNNPVEGIFSWVTPSTGITKGTHTYDTVFTPNDSKYKVLTRSVDVQIGTQRTLSFTVSDLTKTYGDARFDLSTLLNGNRGTGALTWTSSHPHLVSIDQLGIVTLHNATKGTVVTLSVTQADDDQYYDGSASLDLIVNKKSITVSAEDKTMIFGEMMPALTYTTTGLVGTDTLVGSLKVSDNTVGTHDIVQDKTLSHDNYNITFLKGRMVIQYPQAVNDIRDEIELIYRNLSTQGTPTTHEEALKFADEIAMLSVAYNALSEQEKGLISEETKEKLALVQKQAGETNHINDYAMVEGLPWEVRLITEPLSSTTHDYRTIRENMEDVENLTLFNMTLWNTLTNERYTLSEQEIAMITFRDYIAKEGGEIVIVHQLNDGTLEYINPTLKDGWVTFGATSFSAYGIVEKHSPPKETPPSGNVNTGNTTPDTSQETKTDEALPKTGVSQSYIPWYALGVGLILLGVSKRRKNK